MKFQSITLPTLKFTQAVSLCISTNPFIKHKKICGSSDYKVWGDWHLKATAMNWKEMVQSNGDEGK